MSTPKTVSKFGRQRDTVATRRYNANMKLLVGALRAGRKCMFDLMETLSCSPSGIRSYFRPLREFSLLRQSDDQRPGNRSGYEVIQFWIDAPDEDVAAFLAALGVVESPTERPPTPARSPSVHTKGDMRRIRSVAAIQLGMQRDPLVAALFGGSAA